MSNLRFTYIRNITKNVYYPFKKDRKSLSITLRLQAEVENNKTTHLAMFIKTYCSYQHLVTFS